jgi:DNA-binding transcriptional regulator PaaX
MQNAKLVELKEENGIPTIKITKNGKRKLLRYDIESMQLDESSWDGKWRLITYDVAKSRKPQSDAFRYLLKKLKILKLQKSVYLTPFKCEDEIEYLRNFFEIGNEVLILKVGSIENEAAYRKYFGI